MIIDADTHLSSRDGGHALAVERMLEDMTRSRVDAVLSSIPLPEQDDEICPALEELYRATQSYPGRIMGLGYIDPRAQIGVNTRRIQQCVLEYGFAGIRIDARHSPVRLDDEARLFPLVETVAKLDAVLAVHVGSDTFDLTHPFRLEKLAKHFAPLPILVMHMGGIGRPDYCAQCIEVAEHNPNLTLVGSAVYWQRIPYAIGRLGARRLCFGSGVPYHGLMPASVAAYDALLTDAGLSDAERSDVMGGNLSRLLDL